METKITEAASMADRILYAAMKIISESGLKGLSASKLAEAVDISKSTVFHYYRKMDEIPSLILQKLYEDIINPIQNTCYPSARSYLEALGNTSFSCQEEHILLYKAFLSLYQASMHDSRLARIVKECSETFDASLYHKLKDLCRDKMNENQLLCLSGLIAMTLDGIALHYLIEGQPEKAREAWELFTKMITDQYGL